MRKNVDEHDLQSAKRAYKSAVAVGDRKEEARWANIIGNIFKERGEYIKALEWIRKDYEVSKRFLPEKDILPTCNTLGELFLRLEEYKEALAYQKKHLELAEAANNLIEQQRASTQLGRTYHELFMKSDDDHEAGRNAKKYFTSAMKLAKELKENHWNGKCFYLREYVDAHNNLGMIEIDFDNLEEAEKILVRGLEICDEEEVCENDDSRSRLHHNLGLIYIKFLNWEKAEEHIKKDISICESIRHCQGEAKGLINFGELHSKVQRYDKAISCYQKALQLAKSMEDEDALVSQIEENIEMVEAAMKVANELKKDTQNLKKIERNVENSRGTPLERKYLLQHFTFLDRLIEKSRVIFAWKEHLKYATMKVKIAEELCDKEKLADSFFVIGESNQKLRKFKEAWKWYAKSWETYKLIGNLEGQALSKIEMGNILDSSGSWKAALKAYEEGYRIASEANIPIAQLSALENMHYSYMMRFDKVEKARNLQISIKKLERLTSKEHEDNSLAGNVCPETETDTESQSSEGSEVGVSLGKSDSNSFRSSHSFPADLNEDVPLKAFLRPGKKATKLSSLHLATLDSIKLPESSPKSASMSSGSQAVGHKRNRAILLDDQEDENHRGRRTLNCFHEGATTSTGFENINSTRSVHELEDVPPLASNCPIAACTPIVLEESSCSHQSMSSLPAREDATTFRSSYTNQSDHQNSGANPPEIPSREHDMSNLNPYHCSDENCPHIIIKIGDDFIHIPKESCMTENKLSIEQMKVVAACLYYLQMPFNKRETGQVPVVEDIIYEGRTLDFLEALDILNDHKPARGWLEGSIALWEPRRVMKQYIDCCKELSVQPKLKVLKNLYNLEISEDEVIASDCELEEVSAAPLLNALLAHKEVSVIDLSHNRLGYGAMERLKQVLMSSEQRDNTLTLDLHCNSLGRSALFHICDCPALYSRLEALNLSGNRLTDSCASYLSNILKNFQALCRLEIENCSITCKTIQKLAESLDAGSSSLAHLSIGYNSIKVKPIVDLLLKLSALKSFQELSLAGIKLPQHFMDKVVENLCKLGKNASLSRLVVGGTGIGTDAALRLTSSLSDETQQMKLDLSSCELTPQYVIRLNVEVSLIYPISELNLGENPFRQEGALALASLLAHPACCLEVLVLNKCQFGLVGILRILESLSQNRCLLELNLAENIHPEENVSDCLMPVEECSPLKQANLNCPDFLHSTAPMEACTINTEYNELEVADSDDDSATGTAAASGLRETHISSHQKSEPSSNCDYLEKLLDAVKKIKKLQLLDLSNNRLCKDVSEKLCVAWSSSSRGSVAQSHFTDNVVHLAVRGKKCCGRRPCCRKV
ncbi:OLC1v1035784C3 [Oldenlandia corymbosa var. corymbosa]|uniref:OLC1v1035784C3 n=1 Tax=Oldenlandia corymbosa var. corymbosa TaxID=529605 RepID=A0AAV1CWY1_OLDCO|nr:OLC1v1035784C3 [Oldenlandia corymbosa var. corymbosa]